MEMRIQAIELITSGSGIGTAEYTETPSYKQRRSVEELRVLSARLLST